MKLFILALVAISSFSSFADIVKPLADNDPLQKTTEAIATQLADGNIAGGTNLLWVGSLTSSATAAALVKKGFSDAYKYDSDESLPASTKVDIVTKDFAESDVAEMAEALMVANDFNPENSGLRASMARYIWAVLRKMKVDKTTKFGHAKAMVYNRYHDATEEYQYFVLITSNKKTLQLFTSPGSM